jgi:hypothetical protein
MLKYIFITHVNFIEKSTDEYETIYHCNYHCRVDDLLENLTMSELADDPPSPECKELASTVQKLGLVSRFNPAKKYKMSIIVFEDDEQAMVNDLLKQIDDQFGPTIKMIRKSGDSFDL